ncbi:hypothetical protein FGADI_9452 [Fusarium gaditjirri]|uniref:Uncharacterized protein n=1 Tax=Fusarium gaditjirri TaxID=282569 RepID=A0A8H4WSH2_9HYPO|nr:hypothetical protein FGADI_9452 [Fusarium gaditjirri]
MLSKATSLDVSKRSTTPAIPSVMTAEANATTKHTQLKVIGADANDLPRLGFALPGLYLSYLVAAVLRFHVIQGCIAYPLGNLVGRAVLSPATSTEELWFPVLDVRDM